MIGRLPPQAGIDAYHDHLDVCARCEQHPFDLCPEGARLLRLAAVGPEGGPGGKGGLTMAKATAMVQTQPEVYSELDAMKKRLDAAERDRDRWRALAARLKDKLELTCTDVEGRDEVLADADAAFGTLACACDHEPEEHNTRRGCHVAGCACAGFLTDAQIARRAVALAGEPRGG